MDASQLPPEDSTFAQGDAERVRRRRRRRQNTAETPLSAGEGEEIALKKPARPKIQKGRKELVKAASVESSVSSPSNPYENRQEAEFYRYGADSAMSRANPVGALKVELNESKVDETMQTEAAEVAAGGLLKPKGDFCSQNSVSLT